MDNIVWTASPQGDEATLAINMEGPLFSYAAPGSVPCAIAGPVFEIDNALVEPDFAAIRAAGVKELGGGITERRFVADYRGLEGLALTIVVRTAAASPVVRFRYILADTADRKLTKRTTGRDAIEYASFTAAQEARVTEVRLSDFNHLLNCYRPTETTLPAYAFENDLTAPGPILASVSGAGAFLMAYEHGSTLPNTFFEYRLAPDRRVTLAAVKANYFHNRSLKEQPFESVWFDFAAIKGTADGSTDGLAAVFRKFLLEHITPHAASRKPFVSLNTWGFQERSKWLDGAGFLDALEQDRLLEEIDAAHRAGIETFVIDVGWFNSAGDWRPHPLYPEGFKPIRERLDRYGMKLGVWIHAAWAGNDSEVRQLAPEGAVSCGGEVWEGGPCFGCGTSRCSVMCVSSPYGPALAKVLVRVAREYEARYFKLDGVGQYHCDDPNHGHGGPDETVEERRDGYAYGVPIAIARIAEYISEACPGVVVDFDITEGGRSMGLAILATARYFLVNNGPYYQALEDIPFDAGKRGWNNVFVHPGPSRAHVLRYALDFARWVPANLLLAHYLPLGDERSININLASVVLGQNGFWGGFTGLPGARLALIGKTLADYREVRDDANAASAVRQGRTGCGFEVHERLNPASGRGLVSIFSNADTSFQAGDITPWPTVPLAPFVYVTERTAAAGSVHATRAAKATQLPDGRARIEIEFDGLPDAAIVFFK